MNEKIPEEYSVKIYEIDLYFYEHYKEKIQTEKNKCEYILFRINVYFIEYFLAVETDENSNKEILFLRIKDKKLWKKTWL